MALAAQRIGYYVSLPWVIMQSHIIILNELQPSPFVEDIDLRDTRQEGPGYSYGHCQKPGAKLEDGGPEMGLRPGYGLRPVVAIIIMVELVV